VTGRFVGSVGLSDASGHSEVGTGASDERWLPLQLPGGAVSVGWRPGLFRGRGTCRCATTGWCRSRASSAA